MFRSLLYMFCMYSGCPSCSIGPGLCCVSVLGLLYLSDFDLFRLLFVWLYCPFFVLYRGCLPPGLLTVYPGCPTLPCRRPPVGSCVVGGVFGLDEGLLGWWVSTRPP